jgi:hypothetical protein
MTPPGILLREKTWYDDGPRVSLVGLENSRTSTLLLHSVLLVLEGQL